MSVILQFSDIGCLDESAAGSSGAGMASFVNAGIPAARGFVIAPMAFSDYIRKNEIAAALDMLDSGAEEPEEGWRALKSLFARTRMDWSQELEMLTAFGELGVIVSASVTTKYGAGISPVYASRGPDMLEAVKHCWLRWLRAGTHKTKGAQMPAVAVREVMEAEVSTEFRRKGADIIARAVFGLPEGLHDPSISSDIFEFAPDGSLDRMEMRPQNFQYVLKDHGPSKVGISPDLSGEEKLTGQMIDGLREIISFMRQNAAISSCIACFISSRPVICSAELMSDAGAPSEIPPRENSISLLAPVSPARPLLPQGPVVAAKLFLKAESQVDIGPAGETYVHGIMVPNNPLARDSWQADISSMASEAKRLLGASEMVLELGDMGRPTLERLARAVMAISEHGMQPGLLIPGIRSTGEMAEVMNALHSALDGCPATSVWLRIMYPSNLFFMDSLAGDARVLLLDLDSLAKLMLGGSDDGKWLNHSACAMEEVLEIAFRRKASSIAFMSQDLVSTPAILESMVRRGAEIVCVGPSEVQTVRHIIASVEKRMLLEQGRS